MNNQKRLEKAYKDFVNNEDIDQANEDLRASVRNLTELRYIVSVARQQGEEVEDVIETLIAL